MSRMEKTSASIPGASRTPSSISGYAAYLALDITPAEKDLITDIQSTQATYVRNAETARHAGQEQ